MAKTKSTFRRPKTKTTPPRKTADGQRRPRRPSPGPRRRKPQRHLWPWLVAAAAVVALALPFLIRGGSQGSTGSAPFVGGDLHSLVADPANARRLYVGGHEGVAVSDDGGRAWRQVESLAGADAMGWAFTDELVIVGGHPGLFVSEDGGRAFTMRNQGLPATDIHAVGAEGGVIYAASPQVGVFASLDGGRTWEVRTQQAGQSFMGRILVDPGDAEHLVAPDMGAGAVESTDGGRTWAALGGVQGAMWVSWDSTDPSHMVVVGSQAAESIDGGRTWTPLQIPVGVIAVEMSPADPATMYAAALQGTTATVWVSRDGGRTWNPT
jgi:photosystem II stability/assembly factor-like uncharacterized protein